MIQKWYNCIGCRSGSDSNMKKDYAKLVKYMVLCFVVSCCISYFSCVLLSPKIEVGRREITLNYGEEFMEPKYSALYHNRDVSKKVKKSGKVDVSKLGDYKLRYRINQSIFEDKKMVVVHVVDKESPVIDLEGGTDVKVCPTKEYEELGYKANDNYDGELTDNVSIKKSHDKIIYKVSDSSDNKRSITRNISYIDDEKPSITLEGSSEEVVYVGNQYNEPGYKANDNCDGDITNQVEVTNNIDSSSAGSYQVTYKVKDSSNNEEVVVRNVVVKNYSAIRPSSGGSGRGIVYLTFDDGPNEGTTNVILDVLKSEGVPATFFVTCNGPDYLIKRMYDEGHTVALHTASHNYNYLYASVSNYFDDLNRVSDRVERITGVKSMIIRFPGGSSNTISKRISPGIMSTLTGEVRQRGYHYFDWNVDSNDAAGADTDGVFRNVINNVSLSRENVVLMHDVKNTTKGAIRNIIQSLKSSGYTFRAITYDTTMVTHGVNN